MRRSSSNLFLLWIAVTYITFGSRSTAIVAQGTADPWATFTSSLDLAFNSNDLEWLPEQNRLLLKGEINGAPAVFKVDSGAVVTLLTLKSAKDRGLPVIDFNAKFSGSAGEGKLYGSPVKQLQLGTFIALANQRLTVAELNSLDGVDGLLGGDTLVSTKAIIDYRHKRLRVPKDKWVDSLEKFATNAGMSIEKLEREGHYVFATMNYGDKSMRMLIDTGAQRTVIGAAMADRLKMTVRDTDDDLVGAGGQSSKVQKTSIDRLSLGKAIFLNFECVVIPVDYLGSYSKKPIDGVLGADALASLNSVLAIADAVLAHRTEEIDMASKEVTQKP